MPKFLHFLAIFCCLLSRAQSESLIIVDSLTGFPLKDTHLKDELGRVWVANSEGRIPRPVVSGPIVVTHIGYQIKRLNASKVHTLDTVQLRSKSLELSEISLWSFDPAGVLKRLYNAQNRQDLPERFTITERFASGSRLIHALQAQVIVKRKGEGLGRLSEWSRRLKAYQHSLDLLKFSSESSLIDHGFLPNGELAELFFIRNILKRIQRYERYWDWKEHGFSGKHRKIVFTAKEDAKGVPWFKGSLLVPPESDGVYKLRIVFRPVVPHVVEGRLEGQVYRKRLLRQEFAMHVELFKGQATMRSLFFQEEGEIGGRIGGEPYQMQVGLINHGNFTGRVQHGRKLLKTLPWYSQFGSIEKVRPFWIPNALESIEPGCL